MRPPPPHTTIDPGEAESSRQPQPAESGGEKEWWLSYGRSASTLRDVTIKVLSQTSSSSGCERN
ncbi:hypothetical protein Taro_004514 [Colocasia esculenta]|uniref:Uncharacterized protein n=1 Tax=Colocasia esculenta TaxID=4460 RepID=A0A843TK92_COLES|nr:hypothetical protein [Colocasia esculenta]